MVVVIKLLGGIVKWTTSTTKTVIKTSADELAKTRKIGKFHRNNYIELEDTPYMYGDDYLKELADSAIKSKNEKAANIVFEYIIRWKEKGLMQYGDYDKVLKKVGKFLKETDFSDFL